MEVLKPDNKELLEKLFLDVDTASYIKKSSELLESVSQLPQLDLPIFNHFAPNVYMRQMDAPAGALVVSKMHKTEHFNILLKGSLSIATDNGVEFFQAPLIIKSKAGTRRIGYFHEDSSWVTIHPTALTDIGEIENEIIMPEDQIQQALSSLEIKE